MKETRRSVLKFLAGGAAAALPAGGEMHAEARSDLSSTALSIGPSMVSSFAELNGVKLHYLTIGSGPLVVLLHGWPQTSYAWQGVMPALAEHYRVVAPDLRGTGLSERTMDGYDKRTVAEDVRALIAHLGEDSAHVVGHDMGGKAAYFLAHQYPQAVKKLVLVDCLLPGTENMDSLRGGAWHYGFHMASDMPEMLTKGREKSYIRAQIKAWSHKKDAISEVVIEEYAKHYAMPGGMTAGFNYYRALRQDAVFAATLQGRKLAMPVMAITGGHSAGDKLANSLEPYAPDLTSIVAEDSGHFVAEEAPEFFVRHVLEFLS